MSIQSSEQMKSMDQQAQVVTTIGPAPAPKLTLDAVRAKLAGQTGRRYW